jgi:type IV pilus assembly protein PilQ
MIRRAQSIVDSHHLGQSSALAVAIGPVLGMMLGLLLFTQGATAPAQTVASLDSVNFSSLPGEKVQVALTLSAPVPKPLIFTTDNPARVVLDFPGVSNKLPVSGHAIGIGMARSLNAVEAMGRTRVVLSLVKPVPYQVRSSGNNVYITLDGSPLPAAKRSVGSSRPVRSERRVVNVDFRRSNGGGGQVIVTFSEAPPTLDVREEGGKILVDFPYTRIPQSLERRLDVVDFATPVQIIDTTTRGNNVRMTVEAQGDYQHLAYQTDKTFTLEVRPSTREQIEAAKKDKYSGEKLSLNFQDIEVRAILQLLADFTGLNIVTSDTVTGNVTLHLKDVPWDQALDIVLQIKGLGKRQQGNVMWVAPLAEIAAREKQELQALKEREQLAPLRSDFIQINYAKAADIAKLLKAKENSLLSERGAVTVDERTNTLLVQDIPEKLAEIRALVAKLDMPVRQVMIDSRIVIATDTFARDLGVRFGVTSVGGRNGDLIFNSGSIQATDTMVSSALENIGETGQPFPVDIPVGSGGLNDRLSVNLPAAAGNAGKLALAILGANTLLDLELSALKSEGKGEVLSNPRVITADQQEAVIKQGREIPYQQATASGATSVSFKEVVLSLKVIPHITPDDRIRMDLTVSKDTVGENVSTISAGGGVGFVPSIDKREVKTQVLVNNGETVVLGGVFEQTRNNDTDRVPLFSDIPILGNLFKSNRIQDDKAELLIFVTPKIVKENLKLD